MARVLESTGLSSSMVSLLLPLWMYRVWLFAFSVGLDALLFHSRVTSRVSSTEKKRARKHEWRENAPDDGDGAHPGG